MIAPVCRAAAFVVAGLLCAPAAGLADPHDDAIQAPIVARLHSVNQMLGYRLFQRAAVHGTEVDFYVDAAKYDELSDSDKSLVLQAAQTVAAGEWHRRLQIPAGGLLVVVKDIYGQRLAVGEHVIFQPMTSDGSAVP